MAERSDTLRDTLLVAAGAAAGILLGRFGMPLAAKTAGLARGLTGAGGDAFDELIADHKRVLAALAKAEIEEAIEGGDDLRYRARVRTLLESIRRHAQEEETQWFPRVKEILDEKKRALLTGKVDREKAMVG